MAQHTEHEHAKHEHHHTHQAAHPHHDSHKHHEHHARVIVVDEDDNEIGHKAWGQLKPSDIHRASFLWITNSKGQVLLSQRAHSMDHNPGLWTAAVSGTVQEDETYESNIYKEAEEEIGLTGISFNLGPKLLVVLPNESVYAQWFVAVIDRDVRGFHPNKHEVERLKWMDRDEFQIDSRENSQNYSPSVPFWKHLWR